MVVGGEIKAPQKWKEVVSFHLFLKECGGLGGMFPGGPWYLGALISRGIKEQLAAVHVCPRKGRGVAVPGDGSSIPGPSLVKAIHRTETQR